jgi:hypothetical protein
MRPSIVIALALAFVGCTALGQGDDAGAQSIEARAGSFASVRIERPTEVDPDVSAPRAILSAVFARHEGVDGAIALTLLGGDALPLETCADRAEGLELGAADGVIELVDVGELEVRVAGTRAALPPRTFPDLGELVGGAFYAEDVLLGPAVAEVDEYFVSARGPNGTTAFEAVAVAPTGLAEVALPGGDTLDREEDLFIAWDAGDPRDRVEIELAAAGDVLRCAARDDGVFRIPAERLRALPVTVDARLTLRRARQAPFDLAGFDDAWVTVATSRLIHVSVD